MNDKKEIITIPYNIIEHILCHGEMDYLDVYTTLLSNWKAIQQSTNLAPPFLLSKRTVEAYEVVLVCNLKW